ncbi:nucleoside kinase [Shinella zoogloeoides]|uniref:nucleoside kinase n=1 Tax=Shinella zoogloeoides TaxID=352475 RepID=UPI00273F7AA4|nr:nucleoside kinase [Shinella zoogloeoides]WLR93444.1 nucleoside kinase [Shinella zoogloeoides]
MNGAPGLIVHINGWPGTGKLTIGRLLADRLGARLLDNHTMINPAEALFSRRDPLHYSLRNAVRDAVFEHLLRAPPGGRYVFTDALADDDWDRGQFDWYRDLAAQRGARLAAVLLDCGIDENRRRLVAGERAHLLKLTDVTVLESLRARHRLLRPQADMLIELDVTTITAEAAAQAIADRLG